MRSTLLLLALTSATLSAQKAPLREVIVVYKTHFDIGYTDLAANVVTKYRTTMIDDALAVVDASRKLPAEQQFVWTLPGWPMSQILWPGQDAARQARVLQAFREGRFVTHALPFTTHTESLELEDLVRGMRFSSNLAREAGLPLPRDAKMTDVPSHSWVIPTILANSGVEFLHLGCNSASSGPSVPRLFWWEGPDRSRVLTMYSHGGYGTGLVPPADWPYPVWLALIHTGDNHGPPRPDEIEKLLAEARSKLPGVKVRIGRLSDFRDALMQTRPQIPTVRGDMPDTWIQGIMSQPVATRRARNERPRIAALNSLDTLLRAWGADPGPRPDIALAYEKSLLYGEHTWGMDSKRYGERIYGDEWRQAEAAGRFRVMEESWDEHAAYTRAVAEITVPNMSRDLAALAAQVKPAGLRVVVFNPLPWARNGSVEVETAAAGLQDAETRQSVPVQRIGTRLRFIARDVPPLGYKTYIPGASATASPPDAPENVIENSRFRVTLDPQQGAIRSIYEKSTARELVAPGFGQYLYQRFGNNDIDTYTRAYLDLTLPWAKPDMARRHVPLDETTVTRATGLELKIERGPVTSTATLEGKGIRLEVRLDRDSPYIDLAWTIRNKQPDTAPEAGWL
ncbi:MAG: hypothetical protein HY821_05120, partial [Acidobacteria bacterium]|nr:hypothetical protein [Acidobacteriota bacterium]